MSDDAPSPGREFAEALGRKDFDRVGEILDQGVDFRALTPNRSWEASKSGEVVAEILPKWFEDSDVIEEVLSVETDEFADRDHVSYSFRGHNDDGPFVVEQHAYFVAEEGRIVWMRVLCSGFRPA